MCDLRPLYSLGLLLAALYPLLEEVLVVAVCAGPQCEDAQVGELPVVGVDEHGHQAVLLALQLVDTPHHFIGHQLDTSITNMLQYITLHCVHCIHYSITSLA